MDRDIGDKADTGILGAKLMLPQVDVCNKVQFWPILHCKPKQRTEVCDTRGTSSDQL